MSEQRDILGDAGFLGWEIEELLGSPGWEEASKSDFMRDFIDDRRDWTGGLEDQGYSLEQIQQEIELYYTEYDYDSVWEWVREAYGKD